MAFYKAPDGNKYASKKAYAVAQKRKLTNDMATNRAILKGKHCAGGLAKQRQIITSPALRRTMLVASPKRDTISD